jgi:hypothetical protein
MTVCWHYLLFQFSNFEFANLAIYLTRQVHKFKSLFIYTLSTHRLLDINVTKNVHCTLHATIDPARNLKKIEREGLHVMFYYYSA